MNMIANETFASTTAPVSETAWLLGQPSLDNYLSFVRNQVIDGRSLKRKDLVDEWRDANDYYYDLEISEAGLADRIDVRDLDRRLRPLVNEIVADNRYQEAFDTVPTRIAMVELDKLIVSQLHIDISHTDRLETRLGRGARTADLLRFCQPLDRAEPPLTVRRTGKNRYTFWSTSSDFRFHEAKLLGHEQMSNAGAIPADNGILGLKVGYSSNFLSVIESDKRMVLHNGHHRAYALRAMGYTHAPCIIQTVTRTDELNLVASREVTESPAHYFKAARPPLLKDFFDLRIRKVFQLPRILRMVEVSFEVREFEVAG